MKPERTSWWHSFPLRTDHLWLNLLLAAIPVAIALHYIPGVPPLLTFLFAAVAVIPLAGVLGEATDDLSCYVGQRAGGLLNATMGNATELIIAFFALRAGHTEIVKASISGSIIGNLLLVLGMSALAGGIHREHQQFSKRHASINSTMLFIAVIALVMPAVFDLAVFGTLEQNGPRVEALSLWTSVVLVLVYALNLLFTFGRRSVVERPKEEETPDRTAVQALVSLVLATIAVAYISEILISSIDAAKHAMHMSDLFMGVIIIAVIGNAAEHSTAVVMARQDKMEAALSIAVGSSAQIALLVAPLLVFLSWAMRAPMSLVFTPLEIAGIGFAVVTVEMISSDGETTWIEGVQLIAVYLILALAFYYVPEAVG